MALQVDTLRGLENRLKDACERLRCTRAAVRIQRKFRAYRLKMHLWSLEYQRMLAFGMAQDVRDRVFSLLLKTMSRKPNIKKIIRLQAWWRWVRLARKFTQMVITARKLSRLSSAFLRAYHPLMQSMFFFRYEDEHRDLILRLREQRAAACDALMKRVSTR